jgi:hypothetical protein
MVRFKFIIPLLGALALGAGPASAGGVASDTDFRGVNAIHVTASPMSVESVDCNIDSSLLTHDLERQFSGEGLAVNQLPDTMAVVTVLSTRNDINGTCNSAIMLGAYKKASFFDDQAQWLRTGYVVVWQSGLIFSSSADAHLGLARESLGRLAEAMLKDWRNANSTKQSATQ